MFYGLNHWYVSAVNGIHKIRRQRAIDTHFTEYQFQDDPILPVVIRKIILFKLYTLITLVHVR